MMKKVNRVKALALSAMMAFSALSIPAWGADKVNAKSEGQVLNIYSWNEEFPALVADYYPGFVKNDPNDVLMGGKIGDVNVNFVIESNNYRENLMEKLAQNETASADNKVDIFAFEPDYAYDMVNSDYALPISDLGIVDDEIDKQFNYTNHNKNIQHIPVLDKDGHLFGYISKAHLYSQYRQMVADMSND